MKFILIISPLVVSLVGCCHPKAEQDDADRAAAWIQVLPALLKDSSGGGYRHSATNFLKRLQQVTTAEELRGWAELCLVKYQDLRKLTIVRDTEIPSVLHKLEGVEPLVWYVPGDKGWEHMNIDWGGGFGHYGIAVGHPSFEPKLSDYDFFPWSLGVFVYWSNK